MTTTGWFTGLAAVAAFMGGLATVAGDNAWALLFLAAAGVLYAIGLAREGRG